MAENVQSKEGGHWYKKDGTPCYTIIGKNGKERATNIKDAREHNLVPSVTTIIACQSRPGLDAWKQDQTILACLTLARNEGESEQDYIKRLKADAKEQAKKAAERGTRIHAWIQQGLEGKPFNVDGSAKYYESANKEIETHCPACEWNVEEPFATGFYGGKVDLQSDNYVIDIKTTEKDLTDIKTWDDHAQQLSAYRAGTGGVDDNRRCGILYVNVLTAESKLIWIPEEELRRGYDCFIALLNYWRAKNKLC